MKIKVFFILFSLQILSQTAENFQTKQKRQVSGFQAVHFPEVNPHSSRPTTSQPFVIGFPGNSEPRPPRCRGRRKRRPECQGKHKRPPKCRGRRKNRPECQAGGEIVEETETIPCLGPGCDGHRSPNGEQQDEAIRKAFEKISWLKNLSEDQKSIALPGHPDSQHSSQLTRFYQLAHGVRDIPFHSCRTPRFESGHCRFVQHCILPEFENNFHIFLHYVCFIQGLYVGVCCPDSRYSNHHFLTHRLPISSPSTTERPIASPVSRGCGLNAQQQTKIVGGREAELNKFPWAAALLRNQARTQYCGGVLISNRHVLTAAHCVNGFDASAVTVRLGEYTFDDGGETPHKDFPLSSIRMHEDYDTLTNINDIAILTLARTTDFNKSIRPVCLPPEWENFRGQTATVIGWGTIYFGGPISPVLQEVTIPVWDNDECNAAYRDNEVFPVNLCAGDKDGGKDSCQGDSGGPLMLQYGPERRWTVIGVVSWGIRCAEPDLPGVYARVSSFLDWIDRNTV